nr:MAG TPA: hypothetical protein [Caudoviricetes sp.]
MFAKISQKSITPNYFTTIIPLSHIKYLKYCWITCVCRT